MSINDDPSAVVSGKEFNEKFPQEVYYKFTRDDDNVTPGLIKKTTYATDSKKSFYKGLTGGKTTRWILKVPDDATVIYWLESGIMKTDAFILSNGIPISEMKEWDIEDNCAKAIFSDPNNVCHITNPPEFIQLLAVTELPKAIRLLKTPSENVQMAAVRKEWTSIKFIENPSELIQHEAVQTNYRAIEFIKNPTRLVQLIAVLMDTSMIKYIRNPDENVVMTVLRKEPMFIEQLTDPSEALQLTAIRTDWAAIRHIKNPTDRVKIEVAKLFHDYLYPEVKDDEKIYQEFVTAHQDVLAKGPKGQYVAVYHGAAHVFNSLNEAIEHMPKSSTHYICRQFFPTLSADAAK